MNSMTLSCAFASVSAIPMASVGEWHVVAAQGHMLPHSMPVPVRLAWPQMAYAAGLSVPVPLHLLAAQFPQAYSAAAGEHGRSTCVVCRGLSSQHP